MKTVESKRREKEKEDDKLGPAGMKMSLRAKNEGIRMWPSSSSRHRAGAVSTKMHLTLRIQSLPLLHSALQSIYGICYTCNVQCTHSPHHSPVVV